jgi:hypothetical protein
MKVGTICEATAATGDRQLVRVARPTMRANGYRLPKGQTVRDDGYVLVRFMEDHGGGAHIHSNQLRAVSNDA